MPSRYTDSERVRAFWAKVLRSEGCWEWQGSKSEYGYGLVLTGEGHRMERAHRHAWRLTYGAIPMATLVLHRCDNRLCVRPDHLFLGTQLDNMHDCIAKGRFVPTNVRARGEHHYRSKLTAAQVRCIRRRHAQGAAIRALAREYVVSQQAIQAIVRRLNWKHV